MEIPDRDGNSYFYNISNSLNNIKLYISRPIKFMLYTRQNHDEGQRILINDLENVTKSNFNPNHPTRLIIQGDFLSIKDYLPPKLKNTYLTIGEFNVIMVDWNEAAEYFNYIESK